MKVPPPLCNLYVFFLNEFGPTVQRWAAVHHDIEIARPVLGPRPALNSKMT